MKTLGTILALLLLAGCASPQEVAMRRCDAIGLQRGTPEYARCFTDDMNRSLAASQTLGGMGTTIYGISQPRPSAVTTCTPMPLGGFSCTGQ